MDSSQNNQFFASLFSGRQPHSIEYPTDEAAVEGMEEQKYVIDRLQDQLTSELKNARTHGEPKSFKKAEKDAFNSFVSLLASQEFKFVSPLPVNDEKFNSLVIGDISAGKTSIINRLFASGLETGIGDTTQGVVLATAGESYAVWDSAGVNHDLMFYDQDSLNYIASVQCVVIVYSTALLTVEALVKVVNAIKGPGGFVCVRTKCDLYNPNKDQHTIDEEMDRDRAFLTSIDIDSNQVCFFRTAAEGPNEFDNQDLLSLLQRTP